MIKMQENNCTFENIHDICVIENIRTGRHHFIALLYDKVRFSLIVDKRDGVVRSLVFIMHLFTYVFFLY